MRDNEYNTATESKVEHGHRLSSLRLQAGLTQNDVAKKILVSRQHISNIETGATSPTLEVLQHYLEVCGTNLAEFFYGPLPINQTPQQREYHGKLQTLLEHDGTAAVVTKVLDAFLMSMHHDFGGTVTKFPATSVTVRRN